jgi:hypothetical protein
MKTRSTKPVLAILVVSLVSLKRHHRYNNPQNFKNLKKNKYLEIGNHKELFRRENSPAKFVRFYNAKGVSNITNHDM